ncbi:MAG: hypothetical protein GY856_30840 [bacterium]|nr:hypothetical protein [bacterium]
MSDPSPPIWYGRVPQGFWQQSKNRRACMEWLEAKLRIREPEDWYDLTAKTIHYFGSQGLLYYYHGSISAMVQDYVPWYDWKEWLFPKVPSGFWGDAHNRLRYLKWLGSRLGFKTLEDWYRVRTRDFIENRGGALLARTRGGPVPLITSHFPEYEWREWRFHRTPFGFWDDPANRRRYLEWLGDRLGYEEPDDWYGLQTEHLRENHGGGLLARYNGSPSRIVTFNYPEHVWLEWRFAVAQKHFWPDLGNQRRYLKWLGERLGFETPEDWYLLSYDDLFENYGHSLLQRYSSSPCLILRASFPEHEWLEWRFSKVALEFWDDAGNRRRYIEWLRKRLGFEKMEDWYALTPELLGQHYGGGLFAAYGGRIFDLVEDTFPEYHWHGWLFRRVPVDFWDDLMNQRRYLEWLGRKLRIERPEDWYQVTSTAFVANRGIPMLRRYNGSYVRALTSCFPEYELLEWRFQRLPHGFWDDPANRRRAIDWLGEQLRYDDPDDWYLITGCDFYDHGLGGLLRYYNGSPIAAVTDLLTERVWEEWLSHQLPKGYWTNRRNRRRYLDWLGEELGFAEPGDWTRLTRSDLESNRGSTLFKLFDNSVRAVLLNTFPADHPVHRVIQDT